MTDNPVTNSWNLSKGWLSRLWLCDVNGTWSSGSAEAQRKGSQFSVRLPQTCPRLWFSSTHFGLKLSGLLSCCIFFVFFLLLKNRDFFFASVWTDRGKRSYCCSALSNPSLDYLAACQLLTRVCYYRLNLGVKGFKGEKRAQISHYKQIHRFIIWQQKKTPASCEHKEGLRSSKFPDMISMQISSCALVWLYIPQTAQFMSAFQPTDPRWMAMMPSRARRRVRTACWQQPPPSRLTPLTPEATSFSLPSKSCSSKGIALGSFSTRATVGSRYREAFFCSFLQH